MAKRRTPTPRKASTGKNGRGVGKRPKTPTTKKAPAGRRRTGDAARIDEVHAHLSRELKGAGARKPAAVSAEIVRACVTVAVPAEQEDPRFGFASVRDGGQGGGTSRKPGNLEFNIFKACAIITAAAAVGAAATPGALLLGCLILLGTAREATKVDLGGTEASVLWAMWRRRDAEDSIDKNGLADVVNAELKASGYPTLTSQQIDSAIVKLLHIKTIRRATSGDRYLIRERVQIKLV